MDIHRKSVDMDMDMDVKFHIHGNPGNIIVFWSVDDVMKDDDDDDDDVDDDEIAYFNVRWKTRSLV